MYLEIKIKPKRSLKKPIMIIIFKNFSKKAVERNLIKRRIRAILRPLIKNNDFLVFVRPAAKNLNFLMLKKEIFKQLKEKKYDGNF